MSTLAEQIAAHEAHLQTLKDQAAAEEAAAANAVTAGGSGGDANLKHCVTRLFVLVDQMYHVLGNELMRSAVQKEFDDVAKRLGYVKPVPTQVSHVVGHAAPPAGVGVGFVPLPNAPPPLTK